MIAATDILVSEIQEDSILQDISHLSQAQESLRNIMTFLPRLAGFFPEIGEHPILLAILSIEFDLRRSDFCLPTIARTTD
jgi:hypothetical protein